MTQLKQCMCFEGSALKWFKSYLNDIIFLFILKGFLLFLFCNMEFLRAPFWSCSLYSLPLGTIFLLSFHFYADDSHLFAPNEKITKSIKLTISMFFDIKSWFSLHFLHLNESKPEVIVFGPTGVPGAFDGDLGNLVPSPCKTLCEKPGVIIDSALRFDRQINAVVKSFFLKIIV